MRVLVAGPPTAGKSTLARRLVGPAGYVLDFDEIARELGSPERWDHPREIRSAAHALYATRLAQLPTDRPVAVIRSAPSATERRDLADEIGASRVVVLALPPDVLKARAERDARPAWTPEAIDTWHHQYEPDPADRELALTAAPSEEDVIAMSTEQTAAEQTAEKAPESSKEVESLKAELAAALENLAAEKKAREDREAAELSDLEKAQAAAEAAEKRAAEAQRALFVERAVRAHNLPEEVVEFLTGDSEEEISAKAERLASLGKPKEAEPAGGEEPRVSTRPEPALTPGHGGESPAPFDPSAIAEATRGGF